MKSTYNVTAAATLQQRWATRGPQRLRFTNLLGLCWKYCCTPWGCADWWAEDGSQYATQLEDAKIRSSITQPATFPPGVVPTLPASSSQAYHGKLTNVLEEGEKSRGPPVSGVISDISDIEKAALDSAAEALGLSKEQVLYLITTPARIFFPDTAVW